MFTNLHDLMSSCHVQSPCNEILREHPGGLVLSIVAVSGVSSKDGGVSGGKDQQVRGGATEVVQMNKITSALRCADICVYVCVGMGYTTVPVLSAVCSLLYMVEKLVWVIHFTELIGLCGVSNHTTICHCMKLSFLGGCIEVVPC